MTKQDLNKLINASVQYNAYTGTWSIDIDSIYKQYCDDLNAFVKKFVDFQPIIQHYEQEKKEQAREIFEKVANTMPAYNYEELSAVEKNLIIADDFVYVDNLQEIAKEYGVEL